MDTRQFTTSFLKPSNMQIGAEFQITINGDLQQDKYNEKETFLIPVLYDGKTFDMRINRYNITEISNLYGNETGLWMGKICNVRVIEKMTFKKFKVQCFEFYSFIEKVQ